MPIPSSDVYVHLAGRETRTHDLGTPTITFNHQLTQAFTDGTGANQVTVFWGDTRTLTSGATENLDLAGVLVDAFGGTVTFATIKGVLVTAASANTTILTVTRPATNGVALFLAAGDGLNLRPGGAFFWASPGTGETVVAATGDLLTITNAAGASATYTISIVGT